MADLFDMLACALREGRIEALMMDEKPLPLCENLTLRSAAFSLGEGRVHFTYLTERASDDHPTQIRGMRK